MQKLKRPPVFREDGTIEIRLTRGFVAIIDAEDEAQAWFNWSANVTPQGKAYAQRTVNKIVVALHREILGLPPGRDPEADHKDGDSLNCRRRNLRPISIQGNRRNKSVPRNNTTGFMGVKLDKRYGTWSATICGRHLGTFSTAALANEARLKAEREEWGIHPQRAAAHK